MGQCGVSSNARSQAIYWVWQQRCQKAQIPESGPLPW